MASASSHPDASAGGMMSIENEVRQQLFDSMIALLLEARDSMMRGVIPHSHSPWWDMTHGVLNSANWLNEHYPATPNRPYPDNQRI